MHCCIFHVFRILKSYRRDEFLVQEMTGQLAGVIEYTEGMGILPPPPNKYLVYDIKESDSAAPALEIL